MYDGFHPILAKYRETQGQRPGKGKTVQEKYLFPLLFEPGTSWAYGSSTDWAGVVVERVNRDISLEEYMKAHIWEPLGIKDMTFHLEKREDLRQKFLHMSQRDPTTGKAIFTAQKTWDDPVPVAFGGAGVYASMPDYMKALHSILKDDQKLLKPESIDELFRPQLGEVSRLSSVIDGFRQLQELQDVLYRTKLTWQRIC